MEARSSVVLSALALLALAAATDVHQCAGRSLSGLSENVQLIPCKKLPCKLKKGTDQKISIKFTPEKDEKFLTNSVKAEVLGLPLPFLGVDGNSICDKVYTLSGDKASCPLKAGTTYQYKDSFPIETFYPDINVKVRWALKDTKDNEIVCFEVPAKIGK